jgi:hypothetical protein
MADPDDTSPEAEAIMVEAIRRAPVWRRAALVDDLIEATRAFVLADIRRRFPEASADEVRRRLAFRLLTPTEVRRAYGWDLEMDGE